jgi:hypothetical protein
MQCPGNNNVTIGDVYNVADGRTTAEALAEAKRRSRRRYMRGGRVVVKSGRIREVDDIAALATKARALIVESDPDAIRDGLREIADALDAIGQAVPRERAA